MSWLLIILSITVVWVSSLYKILHVSRSQSNAAAFLGTGGKRRVLLVIAHPDDESMFFSPTINYLISRGHNVHILCMSIGDSIPLIDDFLSALCSLSRVCFSMNLIELPLAVLLFRVGNADGIGNIRRDELYQACAVLKIPFKQVKVLDHVDFQDGFGKLWNHNLLAKIVEEEVVAHGIDLILTFDKYGVSGHCNHRDVHHGICNFLAKTPQRDIEAWELISTNLLRKYSGPLDIWLSIFLAKHYSGDHQMHCLLNEHPLKSFQAMSHHLSQWVWFRKLFVLFSSYTYVNTLRRINN